MTIIPTWRLLLLTLAVAVPLALGSFVHVALYIAAIFMVALIALLIVDVRLGPVASDFAVERRHDQRLSLGEPNAVTLNVRWIGGKLTSGQSRRLWLRDESPPEIPGEQPILSGDILPGGEWHGSYDLRPVRRGTYQFGDVWLRVETPFKLAVRQFGYKRQEPARVYPNLRAIRQYDLLARRGRLAEVGVHRTRYLGRGNEFERLRDYLPDDEYRRINWKATARRFRPITVEYETERSQSLLLMVDTGRLMGAPAGDLDKLDHALNSALMLAYVATKMGDRVGTVAFADRVQAFVPPARGDRQFQLLLDTLHGVRVQPVESDLRRTVAFLASRHQRRSLAIFFTDLAGEIDSTTMISSLQLLARRHLVVCASLRDPDLAAMGEQMPTDSLQTYQKVVARRLVEERQRIVERLERFGITTIEGSPESLSPSMINHYLEMKARSRL